MQTRHNIGFYILDTFAEQLEVSWRDARKLQSDIIETTIDGQKCILAKPQTFMNRSGEAVQRIIKQYKIDINNITVVFDDISLDLGKIRMRQGGSAGGHNGIKSLIKHLPIDGSWSLGTYPGLLVSTNCVKWTSQIKSEAGSCCLGT